MNVDPCYSSVEDSPSCSSKSVFFVLMSVLCLSVIISVSLTVSFALQAKECLAAKPLLERMDDKEDSNTHEYKIMTLTKEIRAMEETIQNLRKSIYANNKGSNGVELVGGNEKSGNVLLHGHLDQFGTKLIKWKITILSIF